MLSTTEYRPHVGSWTRQHDTTSMPTASLSASLFSLKTTEQTTSYSKQTTDNGQSHSFTMAEQQMEAAQKARRRTDYESLSEEEDEVEELYSDINPFEASSSSIRQRGRPIATKKKATTYRSTPIQSVPIQRQQHTPNSNSLLDDTSFEMQPIVSDTTNINIPGVAGYLEIEEEPPRISSVSTLHLQEEQDEPIKTSSGLLLTHRKQPTIQKIRPKDLDNPQQRVEFLSGNFRSPPPQKDYFEVENGLWGSSRGHSGSPRHSMAMLQAKRLMSYVKFWVLISFVLLLTLTGVLMHSFHHGEANMNVATTSGSETQQQQQANNYIQKNDNVVVEIPEQILLLPMENISDLGNKQRNPPALKLANQGNQKQRHRVLLGRHDKTQHGHNNNHKNNKKNDGHHYNILADLRDEFETWIQQHEKQYHSEHEKEHRFHIWAQNHDRTMAKNKRHGKCKMTKQHVFGSNHLKDLSPEEFKSSFLTGYKGPLTDELENHKKLQSPKIRKMSRGSGHVLNPRESKNVHPTVKQRLLQQQQPIMTRSANCAWYEIPCWLRFIWYRVGSQIGALEPLYDSDTYPNAVDWRDSGAVTDIRAQGACGACWAITAVETVESAHYIGSGSLYNLAETEIITCDTTCEMCNGGWPQNAFEWVMDHGGLPLAKNLPYDGSYLYTLTQALESNNEATIEAYQAQICPANDANSGSNDSGEDNSEWNDGVENENYADYSDQGRYGNIKGYGYATDRCICYSDGSGCSCNDQDEALAVANLASYGPAVVCLEASLWQDYTSGIITSEIGCTSAFLDMNHCVQVVGYAFTTEVSGDDEDGEDGDNNSGSGSNSGDDNASRQGYWIVRNQWGNYWGMNGYAYVAMGANTCGVLNDMTQAYL